MVQMLPIGPTPTGVSFEAEGGIRNPACQDEDSSESKTSTRQSTDIRQKKLVRELQEGIQLSSKKIEEQSKLQAKTQEFRAAMTLCRTRVPWTFSGNLFVGLIITSGLIFGELGFIPNQKIGFYCDDPKISFKFNGDTVSTILLLSITIILPVLVILLTEFTCYSSDSYKNLESKSSSRSRQFWKWYGFYTLGWLYLLFIVEIVKVVVSEPRPHFIDTCRPKEIVNCTNEYKSVYTCTNTELSWFYIVDSDKSFPSGHAAASIYTSTFLVWYLQKRVPDRVAVMLVKPWLQCMLILWGACCSMSRITDHRHHWWDVLVGGILGVGFATFIVHISCKKFKASCLESGSMSSSGTIDPVNYVTSKKRQSVKKLLSDSGNIEALEGRELGDVPVAWTA